MDRAQSIEAARSFCCLRYEELPDIGLYLEQVLTLINSALAPIQSEPLTGAMISNYVKNKALPAPVHKKYGREHLAYLMVTCMLKQVFTVSQITRLFEIQRETYPLSAAYNFFATEYENALRAAFEFTGEALPCVETKRTEQTILIRAVVLAATNRTEQTILIRAVVLAATNRVYAEKVYF